MRIAIVGTGAVGGYYGGVLARAGQDVHFLVNSDYEEIQKFGLRVDSIRGDFVLPKVSVYSSPQDMPKCDVVLVALKTTQNHLLQELVSPIVKRDGTVFTLQNGMGVEEYIAQWHKSGVVLGGLCFLCSHKVGPGHIQHLDYGKIRMGVYEEETFSIEKKEQGKEVLSEVASVLQDSGVEIEVAESLSYARWEKLVWNIPYNGLCTLWNQTTDQVMQEKQKILRVRALMEEVRSVATEWGCSIPESFVETMLVSTQKMKPYKPSMMLDNLANRPLELEAIYEVPIAKAREKGMEVPEMEKLYGELKGMDVGSQLAC